MRNRVGFLHRMCGLIWKETVHGTISGEWCGWLKEQGKRVDAECAKVQPHTAQWNKWSVFDRWGFIECSRDRRGCNPVSHRTPLRDFWKEHLNLTTRDNWVLIRQRRHLRAFFTKDTTESYISWNSILLWNIQYCVSNNTMLIHHSLYLAWNNSEKDSQNLPLWRLYSVEQ
jgi:hypothetical protein